MNQKNYNLILSILAVLLGNFILALGVCLFILPLDIITGGVAGIAVAINPVIHLPETFIINFLTVSLFIIGAIVLGKAFALKTLLSSIVYPIFVTILNGVLGDIIITDNLILASLYAGVCTGLGIAIVCRFGASTGGMDIPPLIINKYTKIPLAILVTIIDGLTVVLGAATYGIEASMIGLLSVVSCGKTIEFIMNIGNKKMKNMIIISNEYEIILEKINSNIDPEATLIFGKCKDSHQSKPIILTTIPDKYYSLFKKEILEIDPNVFFSSTNVNDINGKHIYSSDM